MRRITISVEDKLADSFDRLVDVKKYINRSEAFRDLVRRAISDELLIDPDNANCMCVGSLSYVYDHHERQLANRINQIQHAHHDVIIASQHVHLDHDNCMETVMMKGKLKDIHICVDSITSQTGITHGYVHIIPFNTN